jgi:pimeloyl-ACP methyl ester carboxylesterase
MGRKDTDPMVDSFEVLSLDGTILKVWVGGVGPPIVLVHGSFTDHSAWAVPSVQLEEHFRVEQSWEYMPGQFDGIQAPTLLLSGSESPSSVVSATGRAADAIADSRIHVLDGHGHFAHRTDPAMVVSLILEFVS